jgi:hypothetical protein
LFLKVSFRHYKVKDTRSVKVGSVEGPLTRDVVNHIVVSLKPVDEVFGPLAIVIAIRIPKGVPYVKIPY